MGLADMSSSNMLSLFRLVYLLQYGSLEKNVFYLLDYIFPVSENIECISKLRILVLYKKDIQIK